MGFQKRRATMLMALGMVFLLAVSALTPWGGAVEGRDFAGFYEVTDPLELGSEVRVTFAVRIFNYSGADVGGATVTLEGVRPPRQEYGSYPGTYPIPEGQSVRLAAEFTVAREEYERWQEGGTPCLRIVYRDVAGNLFRRRVELAAMAVGEE